MHYFDSQNEVNPASGQVSEFLDSTFEDNLTFDTSNVRFKLQTPATLDRVLDFNMGTKRTSVVFDEHVKNFAHGNLTCEKVHAEMRDGF